jgi:hypothetical protein
MRLAGRQGVLVSLGMSHEDSSAPSSGHLETLPSGNPHDLLEIALLCVGLGTPPECWSLSACPAHGVLVQALEGPHEGQLQGLEWLGHVLPGLGRKVLFHFRWRGWL